MTKNAPQMMITRLGQAFASFLARRACYPQFRKKGVHDRFILTNDPFAIDSCRICVPAGMGFFELWRQLEYRAAMRRRQVVVADRYYVSGKTRPACSVRRAS